MVNVNGSIYILQSAFELFGSRSFSSREIKCLSMFAFVCLVGWSKNGSYKTVFYEPLNILNMKIHMVRKVFIDSKQQVWF